MKTQFKVGMKVDDGIGVGVVCGFSEGYPVVTFQRETNNYDDLYDFTFSDADIEYLKEYKEEQDDI